MSEQLNFSLRLSADGSAFVGQVRVAREELDRLKKTTDDVSRGGDQMGASLAKAAALGAAGGLVIAEVLIRMAKAAVEAFTETVRLGEAFANLQASTGSSIETMSRQADAARIGGAAFEDYSGVLLKLARSLNGVDQESTKAQKALASLGITTRDPAEALQQLAVKLDQYADGAGKVAIVNDILGRGGARTIPMLQDIARSSGAAATMTTQLARESEALARDLRTLNQEAGAFFRSIMSSVIPALASTIDAFKLAREHGLSFVESLNLIGNTTANAVEPRMKQLEKDISALRETIDSASAQKDDPYFGALARQQIGNATEALRLLIKEYSTLAALKARNDQIAGKSDDDQVSRRARKRELPDTSGDSRQELDEYTRLIDRLNQEAAAAQATIAQLFSGEQIVPAQQALEKLVASDAWKKLSEPQQIEIKARFESVIAAQKAARDLADGANGAAKSAAEYAKGVEEWAAKQEAAYRAVLASADQFVAQLDLETRTLGMTSQERQRYIVLQQLQAQMEQRAGESAEDYAARLDEVRKRIEAVNNAVASNQSAEALQASLAAQKEYWKAAYTDIANTITDSIVRAFGDIKNAGRYLRQALEQLFQNWVIRPIVQASVQGLSGGMASIFTGLQGGLGGFNPLGLAGGGGGGFNPLAFLAGGASPFIEGSSAFIGPLAEGAGLLGGLMSTAGAFLPYIGIALAAASAFGLFSKDPSEVMGKFDIAPGTGGFEDNAYTSSRFGNLGFADDGTKYFSGEGAQFFNQMIAGALDAIASRLTDEQIAAVSQKLQGIDFKGEEGTYTTEDFIKKYGADILKQVVAVAMEELNPAMAALIANFKGTADETVTFANALLQINDALTSDPVTEAETAWTQATQSIIGSLADQRAEVLRLAAEYDGSAAATTALANATTSYRNAVVQTLVAIKKVAAELESAIGGAREHLETQGLSEQELYNYYKDKGDTIITALDTANTPEAVQALGNQAIQYLLRSFDLMPEKDQATQREAFLANLQRLQDLINARLAEITAGVTDGTDDPFQAVQDALSKAASTLEKSADTIDKGAATIDKGANTLESAVTKFTAAVGKFADTKIEVAVHVDNLAQVGGQA